MPCQRPINDSTSDGESQRPSGTSRHWSHSWQPIAPHPVSLETHCPLTPPATRHPWQRQWVTGGALCRVYMHPPGWGPSRETDIQDCVRKRDCVILRRAMLTFSCSVWCPQCILVPPHHLNTPPRTFDVDLWSFFKIYAVSRWSAIHSCHVVRGNKTWSSCFHNISEKKAQQTSRYPKTLGMLFLHEEANMKLITL